MGGRGKGAGGGITVVSGGRYKNRIWVSKKEASLRRVAAGASRQRRMEEKISAKGDI